MESILEAIGNTPFLRLRRCAPANGAELWLKLEYRNPTGSMKDRIALAMIEGAERDGVTVQALATGGLRDEDAWQWVAVVGGVDRVAEPLVDVAFLQSEGLDDALERLVGAGAAVGLGAVAGLAVDHQGS